MVVEWDLLWDLIAMEYSGLLAFNDIPNGI